MIEKDEKFKKFIKDLKILGASGMKLEYLLSCHNASPVTPAKQ